MKNKELASIAKETMRITKDSFYQLHGNRILLDSTDITGSFDDVVVLSPSKLQSIVEDEDGVFERSFYGYDNCEFYLLRCDSYEAAAEMERPLVMNFANAVYPGGGFLNGARAQEESLCRNSTLYASLTSKKAYEMYDYNFKNKSVVDSDYMLLSPHVMVFRDANRHLLEKPYQVAVMTIPAPNKRGKAIGVKQTTMDMVMKERLRKFLMAAARYGYSELVLGAWGCGAFGHDTRRVAQYFYELFFEEHFDKFFKLVTFAILSDDDKCDAFMEVFGDQMIDCRCDPDSKDKTESECVFIQTTYPFPVCNHTSQIEKENVGYTQGILNDGMPFEAEIWAYDQTKVISFILPDRNDFYLQENGTKTQALTVGKVTGFHNEATYIDDGVLCIGMAIRDEAGEDVDVIKTVDYLVEKKLVSFPGSMMNGAAATFTDIEGHDFIRINITLEENGEIYATTTLSFMDFPNRIRGTKLEIVK